MQLDVPLEIRTAAFVHVVLLLRPQICILLILQIHFKSPNLLLSVIEVLLENLKLLGVSTVVALESTLEIRVLLDLRLQLLVLVLYLSESVLGLLEELFESELLLVSEFLAKLSLAVFS